MRLRPYTVKVKPCTSDSEQAECKRAPVLPCRTVPGAQRISWVTGIERWAERGWVWRSSWRGWGETRRPRRSERRRGTPHPARPPSAKTTLLLPSRYRHTHIDCSMCLQSYWLQTFVHYFAIIWLSIIFVCVLASGRVNRPIESEITGEMHFFELLTGQRYPTSSWLFHDVTYRMKSCDGESFSDQYKL